MLLWDLQHTLFQDLHVVKAAMAVRVAIDVRAFIATSVFKADHGLNGWLSTPYSVHRLEAHACWDLLLEA